MEGVCTGNHWWTFGRERNRKMGDGCTWIPAEKKILYSMRYTVTFLHHDPAEM